MIDLAKAKLHCRVDHDDEDTLIQAYIDAANEQIQAHLDRKVIATETERVNENDLVDNKALDAARLLFVAHLYANRVKLRIRKDIDTGMRVLFDGQTFQIVSPPKPDNENGRIYMTLELSLVS